MVRLTEKEKAQLAKDAERKHLHVSAWVRFLLFENRIVTKVPR